MDDAAIVGGLQRLADLPRDRERLVVRNRAASNALGQILALDELHDQRAGRFAVLEAVDLRDVGMIEGGERACFPREAGAALRIGADRIRKNL